MHATGNGRNKFLILILCGNTSKPGILNFDFKLDLENQKCRDWTTLGKFYFIKRDPKLNLKHKTDLILTFH